jgi:hypothetical protein
MRRYNQVSEDINENVQERINLQKALFELEAGGVFTTSTALDPR